MRLTPFLRPRDTVCGHAPVAQRTERRPAEPEAGSSILPGRATPRTPTQGEEQDTTPQGTCRAEILDRRGGVP